MSQGVFRAAFAGVTSGQGRRAVAGAAIGRHDFADDILSETGRIEIGVNGTGIGTFDRMFVDGQIQIEGALDLSLSGGYVPQLNDMVTIITAPGGVLGEFAEVNQPVGMPIGLLIDVDDDDNQFVRRRIVNAPIHSADFDLDGDVDAADLGVWKGAFQLNQLGDADGDNDSDDFFLWQRHPGSVPALAALGAVPEPSTAALWASGPCWRRACAVKADDRRGGLRNKPAADGEEPS